MDYQGNPLRAHRRNVPSLRRWAVAARKATAYGLGLNWYFSENLKWVINYEQTSFDGGAPAGTDRDDEKVFLTRLALGF